MTGLVDISVLGDKELEKRLRRLEGKTQRKVVRQALRKSAKRIKTHVDTNLSGLKVNVLTGALREAFRNTPIKGATRRGVIRVGIPFPERELLGIAPSDPHYYPTAVEYGHGNVPPHPYLRPAVDEHKALEFTVIGRDIGKGIEREASR